MRVIMIMVGVIAATLLASAEALACPTTSPVDCNGYCCPTAYGFCCNGQCGASANCGNPQDAAPPVLTCQTNQAQIVANCGGDVCGCSDICAKNFDCASGCCHRGRCANACVCTGDPAVVDWSLCGSTTGPSKGGCDVGGSPLGDAGASIPLALGCVSLLRWARRRRQAA